MTSSPSARRVRPHAEKGEPALVQLKPAEVRRPGDRGDLVQLREAIRREGAAQVHDALRVIPVGREIAARLGGVGLKHGVKNGNLGEQG